SGETILAAPPSKTYWIRKFIRRNRTAVAAAASVLLAVTIGCAVAITGYIAAARARDAESAARQSEAEQKRTAQEALVTARHNEQLAQRQTELAKRESAKSRAVSDFFEEVLGGVAPARAKANRDITVRELVDESAKNLDEGKLQNQPEVAAVLLGTIGGV